MKVLERNAGLPARRVVRVASASLPRQVSVQALSGLVRPGELVYVPGASGAPLDFVSSLLARG